MSYNRTFSQPAFWDFVASLRGRDYTNEHAYEALDGAPPAWGGPRAGRRGFGRRNRNRNWQAVNPLASASEMQPTPATLAGDEKGMEMPPAYPMETGTIPATYNNEKSAAMESAAPVNDGGETRGFGGFRRLRMRLREQGLSEDEISGRIEKRRARRAALANGDGNTQGPRARRIMRLREQGLSEEEIAARLEKRRARRAALANGNENPQGPGARRVMRLREKGLSEEEIAARFEKRRARLAARANSETQSQGPSARAMPSFVSQEDPLTPVSETGLVAQEAINRARGQGFKRRNGNGFRTGGRRALHSANTVGAEATGGEEAIASSGNAAIATPGQRGGGVRECRRGARRGRGGRGMHQERPIRLEDITKGGPAKFAGRFPPQGANPSNGNTPQDDEASDGCPACGSRDLTHADGSDNGPGMLQGMRGLKINSLDNDKDSAAGPAMRKRQLAKTNKMNKGNGAQKIKGKPFKPRADVFDTAGSYIIHVALPGAKQENVGVTWEPEKSAIRVAGVIERPPPGELGKECSLLRGQRAVGTFDRMVKLGKKGSKVKVYENGITALLEDGILNVEVPKYDGAEDEDGFVEINEKV